VLNRYRSFVDLITRLNLPASIDIPPLVSVSCKAARTADLQGKELQSLLNIKPSRLLAVILDAINIWQLDHPEARKEQCISWVKETWGGERRTEWEASAAPPTGSKRKR